MKTKTLKDYEGYEGIDADLATSLFEYGLIWKKGIEGHENDYHFIFGVGVNNYDEYNLFDWGDLDINTNVINEFNWIDDDDWKQVFRFVGLDKNEFFDRDLPFIVYDLVQYFGTINIFGGSYYPFKIKESEG